MHRVIRKLQEMRTLIRIVLKPRASCNPQEQNPKMSWGENEVPKQKSEEVLNDTSSDRAHPPPLNAPSFHDLRDRVDRQEEEIRSLLETIKSYEEILDRLTLQLRKAEDEINSYCMGSFYCNASETLIRQKKLLEMARRMVGDSRRNMNARIFVSKIRATERKIEIYLLLIALIIVLIHDHLKHPSALPDVELSTNKNM